MATTPRYQIRNLRGPGKYVEDTLTGRVWVGLATASAQRLADYLNRVAYQPGDRVRDTTTNAAGTVASNRTKVRLADGGYTRHGITVDFDHGTTYKVLPESVELITRGTARDESPAPVWRDQQLTLDGTTPDAEQGALFAL